MTLSKATDIYRPFDSSKYWGDEEVVCEIEEMNKHCLNKHCLKHFEKFGWMEWPKNGQKNEGEKVKKFSIIE